MNQPERKYLPAAGRDWALPLYDPVITLMGGNSTRRRLIEQAGIASGQRVLEIGCGTGTVLLEVKRRYPDVSATGIDPDPKALARARRKSERARVSIQFDRGFADTLPYADGSFDRVLSSFMLHHVPSSERDGVAREARRVLKAGGALHLVDLAAGHGRTQLVHSEQALAGNAEDRVIALLARAGFDRPSLTGKAAMFFGHIRINYYQAFA